MSCTARDILRQALMLYHRNETGEAATRAVVSRAYYGAYHAARAYRSSLRVPGSVGQASGTHQQLIHQLQFPGLSGHEARLSRELGNALMNAHWHRVRADYRPDDAIDRQSARQTLTQAARIVFRARQRPVKARR